MGKARRNKGKRKVALENKSGFGRGLKIFSAALLLAMSVAVLGTFCFIVYRADSQAAQQQTDSAASTLIGSYVSKHEAFPRKHWLTAALSPEETLSRIEEHKKKISSLLQQYQDVSPLAGKIYKEFANFRISTFYQGGSQTVVGAADKLPDPRSLEICFVPENQGSHPGLQSTFAWYHWEWRAVIERDDICPDAFMAAILYHELSHALADKRKAALQPASDPWSDPWIEEEVKAHELEWQILDRASQGRLTRLYDSILARAPKVASLETVIKLVSAGDLEEFDKLFGLEQEPEQMAGVYLAEFEIGLFLWAIDLLPISDKAKLEKKITAYRWIANTVQ